jgi:hypothetical protein
MLLPCCGQRHYHAALELEQAMNDTPIDVEPAEILQEYGPYPNAPDVHGVTFDGEHVWIAVGDRMLALAPNSGEIARTLEVPARAGSAFDGRYLYQIANSGIQKIEHASGRVVTTLSLPCENASGMAWADGYLWIGEYKAGKVHQVDPNSGAIVRSLQTNSFVTGVMWVEGELWHGAAQQTSSELREIDPHTGSVRRRIGMPADAFVSGIESNGSNVIYCGGGASGKLRAVRRRERRKP